MVTSDFVQQLLNIRAKLSSALELDRELYARDEKEISVAVAIIIHSVLGGELVQSDGTWFNRIEKADQVFDVDFAGVNGLEMAAMGQLYPDTVIMSHTELSEDVKELALSLAKIASVS